MRDLAEQFSRDGYAMLPALASRSEVAAIAQQVDDALCNEKAVHLRGKVKRKGYALRNLLDRVPLIAQWAISPLVLEQLAPLFAPSFGESTYENRPVIQPVRGILFDKAPHANWCVGWHQDQAIAVRQKPDGEALIELQRAGFGPWSVKDGLVHVEPPADVLDAMVTIRLHLDTCTQYDGPLRVIPGSHALGRLTVEQTKQIVAEQTAITCKVNAGDAMVMKPLLLHASGRVNEHCENEGQDDLGVTKRVFRRRVVHIEYAAVTLPAPLRWCSPSVG
jgi:hypothetical protein